MKPLIRKFANPHKSASTFRHNVGRTKSINLKGGGFRGGIRL